MPTIIDRYLLRQFAQNFCICFISMAGLYVVVDAFTNLDSFLAVAEQTGGLGKLMGRFYFFRVIAFFDQTSGVLAMASALITLTMFQTRNELTALLAAGVSKARVAAPVICGAVALSLIAAAGRELVLPRFGRELSQNPRDLLDHSAQVMRPRYDNKTGVLMNGKETIAKRRVIVQPNFQLPDVLDRYGPVLSAASAQYQPPREDRPGGYRLHGVRQPSDLTKQPSLLDGQGETVILCPTDTPWLDRDEVFVISEVRFEQLIAGEGRLRFSSLPRMIESLKNESLDFNAGTRVAIHSRLVRPLLDVTLLMIGLPLVLLRENRNFFYVAAAALLVIVAFTLTNYACDWLGASVYVAPHLAAWLPLMIFAPAAGWMSVAFGQ